MINQDFDHRIIAMVIWDTEDVLTGYKLVTVWSLSLI